MNIAYIGIGSNQHNPKYHVIKGIREINHLIKKLNLDDNVKNIFFETFPLLAESDFDWEKTQNNYDDWDSFAQLNLITLTEAKFEINFSDDEITSINSAKSLLDIVKSKI